MADWELDPGFLLATNPHTDGVHGHQNLGKIAADAVVPLIDALMALPKITEDDGTFIQLPPPLIRLPRALPPPQADPETKWEMYKAKRGLKTNKKESKIWDEELQRWLPRFGYRRLKAEAGKEKAGIIELPDNYQFSKDKDPFLDRAIAKRERVSKQESNRQRNISFGRQKRDAAGMLATSSIGAFDSAPITVGVGKAGKKAAVMGKKAGGSAKKLKARPARMNKRARNQVK